MRYGRYHFDLVFESDAYLPAYKGSTFRGLFGTALKKVVCALKKTDCGQCLLWEGCIYRVIFEIPSDPGKGGRPSPPHPFILEPPLDNRTQYPVGEQLTFSLILLGKANEYLPHVVFSVEQMGVIGLGKKTEGRRGAFRLEKVRSDGRILYDRTRRKLKIPKIQEVDLETFQKENHPQPVKRVHLRLLTPLRLKFGNRLRADLPFHVLVRAALRRIAQLHNHFGSGEPRLDYRGLVERAQAIQTEKSTLEWFDWKRYSNRQDQAMLMGGVIGEVEYKGDLTEFIPLLRYAEKIHLGKATTFGLGWVALSVFEAESQVISDHPGGGRGSKD